MNWLQQLAAHARHRPPSLAITGGGQAVSHADLASRAAGLAHRLRAAEIGAESLVALALPQGAARLTAALGVLQAGAAYLPLGDREAPGRLEAVLRDAQPDIVLAPPEMAESLAAGAWQTWILGSLEDLPPAAAGASPLPLPQAADLAYVIYTSGSTGAPKGVEIEHGSLARLIAWHIAEYRVGPADRAALLAYPGFDAAVWELWPYWAAGASVHIPPADVRLEAAALRDWLLRQEITLAFAPTPLAEQLLALAWPARPPLRALLTGGDRLRRRPTTDLPFPLCNHYGPTEATVVATHGRVSPAGNGLAPIGRPVPYLRLEACDEQRRPVAAGAEGELWISGPGLARGYRHDPALTAERFGGGRRGGERWYRTGDRARRNPDGEWEFLGRADRQIKIRGWRIEPAEIERQLLAHPAVAAVVVEAVPAAPVSGPEPATEGAAAGAPNADAPFPRLVAYLAARGTERPGLAAMRAFLRSRLPEAMLPDAVRWLAALPQTPQGKWDRAALSQVAVLPAIAEAGRADLDAPPPDAATAASPTVDALAAILAEALGLPRVGPGEDFFLLGGHSLLGVQLVARVREELGVALPLRCIFDFPTAAQLAAEVDRRRAAASLAAGDGAAAGVPAGAEARP